MDRYVLITGSAGLIGSEAVEFFAKKKFKIIGIDNNYRKFFFGNSGSVGKRNQQLKKQYKNYKHFNLNLNDFSKIKNIFSSYNSKIKLIIHAAAQPSHDWALKNPLLDFDWESYFAEEDIPKHLQQNIIDYLTYASENNITK